jgi:hypothetical protein
MRFSSFQRIQNVFPAEFLRIEDDMFHPEALPGIGDVEEAGHHQKKPADFTQKIRAGSPWEGRFREPGPKYLETGFSMRTARFG